MVRYLRRENVGTGCLRGNEIAHANNTARCTVYVAEDPFSTRVVISRVKKALLRVRERRTLATVVGKVMIGLATLSPS
jgi:hypothetical protein